METAAKKTPITGKTMTDVYLFIYLSVYLYVTLYGKDSKNALFYGDVR
jgi:hypothetical protein